MTTNVTLPNATAAATPFSNPKRKKALTAIASLVVIAGLSWGAYEWLVASHYESTDNAYVQGNVIQITPQINGTVMAIFADDTDFVKAGQPLVKLDPQDLRLAVQTITMPDDRFEAYRSRVDWMQTYIFPGSCIPSLDVIRRASTPFGLALAGGEDIGDSYAPTLRAWRAKFLTNLPHVRALGFDPPFIRTWLMYLAFSEAAFASRSLGDHQLIFTR